MDYLSITCVKYYLNEFQIIWIYFLKWKYILFIIKFMIQIHIKFMIFHIIYTCFIQYKTTIHLTTPTQTNTKPINIIWMSGNIQKICSIPWMIIIYSNVIVYIMRKDIKNELLNNASKNSRNKNCFANFLDNKFSLIYCGSFY